MSWVTEPGERGGTPWMDQRVRGSVEWGVTVSVCLGEQQEGCTVVGTVRRTG